MPTKPNRAGQQQNYVPQGNGDASGKYADEATGSNKHFSNFKKPEEKNADKNVNSELTNKNVASELTKPEEPREDTSKYLGGSKAKSGFSAAIQARGFSKYGEEAVEKIKNIIANADEQSIAVFGFALNNRRVEFIKDETKQTSYFNKTQNLLNIRVDQLEREFEEKGETVFHELGHFINDAFKITEEHGWHSEEVILTDAHKIFDDFKSVSETLQEELEEFSLNKYAPKIRADRRKYVNQKLKPYGFTVEQIDRDFDKAKEIMKSEEWQSIRNRIKSDWETGAITIEEANGRVKEALANWKKTGSYKDFFEQFEKQKPIYLKYQNEWAKLTGIKAVSDVWSSKSDYGFGYGHERGYYKKSWANPEPQSLIADELWANFMSAKTTHNNKVLETTQKYFPRTYEKMVKLVEYLDKKRLEDERNKEEIARFQRGEKI